MEKLKKEEYEFLSRYSDRLESASKSAYINRSMPTAVVHKMREIYSRLIGKPYAMNENCGSCILTLCRKLKPIYDEYEKSIQGNSTGRTTETQSDPSNVSGGEEQTGNTNSSSE